MSEQKSQSLRSYTTVAVILAELAHLAWEYFNGGIKSHHFLNRSDMPTISNWWGLLLLPALTWFFTGAIQSRIAVRARTKETTTTLPTGIFAAFTGSLLLGISLSTAFINNYENVAAVIFFGLLLLALVFPVYHGEYLLGFILGMTFTFGAILPMFVSFVIAILSAILHLLVYPLLLRCWTWVRKTWSSNT